MMLLAAGLLGLVLAAGVMDRHALVSRHDVVLTAYDGERPLQVGNGGLAFGMDATGLQTFAPFNTMSDWGWHSSPPPEDPREFRGQVWETHGQPVRYPMSETPYGRRFSMASRRCRRETGSTCSTRASGRCGRVSTSSIRP